MPSTLSRFDYLHLVLHMRRFRWKHIMSKGYLLYHYPCLQSKYFHFVSQRNADKLYMLYVLYYILLLHILPFSRTCRIYVKCISFEISNHSSIFGKHSAELYVATENCWHLKFVFWRYVDHYRVSDIGAWLEVKPLTHRGRVTHICVIRLTIIGPDNGLWPGRRQAIVWTNAGILLSGTLRTIISEILSEIHTFSFKNMLWKYCVQNGGHFVSASMCLRSLTVDPESFLSQTGYTVKSLI